ncbi:hypothetical protein [Anaerosphaera multitolerans]|uniref:Na+/glutamate symporter n=1 Tax=Anaerosphaera multitolerans TaxID=2487351 RepID=A0A437S5E3_9FIRM|nr:hypothetical protein [Anaerosphaera multitolerans]RVU54230.1 hypothetical protein EF514_08610 [Anaerosphaera multitolerans]
MQDMFGSMAGIIAIAFILLVFAIGDIISVKTKSIVSMMFTSSVILLLGFWLGVPTDLFETSQLLGIGGLIIVILLAHMGTLLNFQQLKEQWRTVVVAIFAIIGIAVFLFIVGGPIIGKETAIVAAPPIAGGVVAGIQMGEAAAKIGRDDLQILATLLVVVQGFFGYPIASYCLRKVAKKVQLQYREGDFVKSKNVEEYTSTKPAKLIPETSAKYASNNVYLAKVALVALLATGLSVGITKVTGKNILDKNIAALLLGIIFSELGFLEKDILTRANSQGLAMAALMVVIFSSLAKATPDIVLQLLPSLFLSLLLGVIGIGIASFIGSKVVKMDFFMAFAIGTSALFGFPGTFIISNEVANSIGEGEEETQFILNEILPKMLVAGFITVSIASVILAGIMAPMLGG